MDRVVASLLACATAACLSAPLAGPQLIGDGRAILFAGNSLTYVNDVPGIVQALADSAHGDHLAVATWPARLRLRSGAEISVDARTAGVLQAAAAQALRESPGK